MKIWAVEKKWISFEAQILFCTAGLPPFLTSVCVCLDQPSLSRLPSCRCSAGCLLHQSPSTLLLGRSPVEAQGFSNIWKETKKAQTWGLKVPPGEALLLPSGFWVLQDLSVPMLQTSGTSGSLNASGLRSASTHWCEMLASEWRAWGCCQVLLENISSNEGQKAFQISHREKTCSREVLPGLSRQITKGNQEQGEKSSPGELGGQLLDISSWKTHLWGGWRGCLRDH